MSEASVQDDQVLANFRAYESRHMESLEAEHLGKTVLLHECEVVGVYPIAREAYDAGCERFGLGNFSIQIIGARPIHLGAMTPGWG